MIRGQVVGLQAQVGVILRLPNRPDLEITFVVDTGFQGELTLPPAAVQALGLSFVQEMSSNLANDSFVKTDSHVATIVWNGYERDVLVLALGRRPLLGTALLENMNLNIDFVDGGLVRIESVEAQS